MAPTWSSHVFEHGPLQQLGPRLWTVKGKLKRGSMPRNMVVHTLPSGGLWLHSVIALNEATMAQLEALGRPEVMVVPSAYHRVDAGVFKQRYPALRVLAPNAAIKAVQKVVAVDQDCESGSASLGVVSHTPEGLKPSELVYELNMGNNQRALVFNDALMNMPHLPGFDGKIIKWLGSSGFFGLTRVGKWLLLDNAEAYRRWLLERAATPMLGAITVSHGECITNDCAGALREAAARLK